MNDLKENDEVWAIQYELLPGKLEHTSGSLYCVHFAHGGMRYYRKDQVYKTRYEALTALIKQIEDARE